VTGIKQQSSEKVNTGSHPRTDEHSLYTVSGKKSAVFSA